ncbi:MAG: hypothetical protein RLZZ28_2077 [Bacteroidota bacterium]|jgi:hypothetical protein
MHAENFTTIKYQQPHVLNAVVFKSQPAYLSKTFIDLFNHD